MNKRKTNIRMKYKNMKHEGIAYKEQWTRLYRNEGERQRPERVGRRRDGESELGDAGEI